MQKFKQNVFLNRGSLYLLFKCNLISLFQNNLQKSHLILLIIYNLNENVDRIFLYIGCCINTCRFLKWNNTVIKIVNFYSYSLLKHMFSLISTTLKNLIEKIMSSSSSSSSSTSRISLYLNLFWDPLPSRPSYISLPYRPSVKN